MSTDPKFKAKQIRLHGPDQFLGPLFDSVIEGLERGHSNWMGIVEHSGAGSGHQGYDTVRLQVHDKVSMDDARILIPLILDWFANENNLTSPRAKVEIEYPDTDEA